MAASTPEICPAQSCIVPETLCTSALVIGKIILAIIHLSVSPIRIGQTPGFLLRAINLPAMSAEMLFGSTKQVHSCLAVEGRELHSSSEARPKLVHNLLHPFPSTPEGPAAPSVRRAADLMQRASKDSKNDGVSRLRFFLDNEHRMGWLTVWVFVH